jgi:hypothetical protein
MWKFLEYFNSKNLEGIIAMLHPEFHLSVFSIQEGRYIDFRGIDGAREFYGGHFSSTDQTIEPGEIYMNSSDRFVVRALMHDSFMGDLKTEKTTSEIIHFIRFKGSKFIEIENRMDTYNTLRNLNLVSIKSNSKRMIKMFIDTLKRLEIVSEEWLKE